MNTKLNRSDLLEALGLSAPQRQPDLINTVLPALGLFGAGMLVGAGIALALAPKPGREIRADVYRSAGNLGNTLRERLPVGKGGKDEVRATATQPPVRS